MILAVTRVGMGQETMVRGRVIDKITRQAVVAANIVLSDGTGTYSGAGGNFEFFIDEFPVTITVSHISYGKTLLELTENLKDEYIIELEQQVSEIGEVQVSASRLRILTEKDDYTLQDFTFDNEHLWMIGYRNNLATEGRLWLANWFGDTITSVKIRNPERLFTDVFGNAQLVMKDSVHQLYFDGTKILFPYSFGLWSFLSAMNQVKAGFAGKLVYQKYLDGQQGLHTYYYSADDPKPCFLTVTRYMKEENSAAMEHIFGPSMELLDMLWSPSPKVRAEAKIAIGMNKQSLPYLVNRKVQVPLFALKDSLYIINLYKDSLIKYSPEGKFVKAVPITFHKDSLLFDVNYRDLRYLTDPIGQRVYLLQRKTTAWRMTDFDPSTGRTGLPVALPDFPGMTSIKVFGQAVYFLYPEKKYPYYVRLYRYQL